MEADLRRLVAIYVDTNLNTRFVFQAERSKTFGELRGILTRNHKLCYPKFGEVGLQDLMVEVNSSQFLVLDPTPVGVIFVGKKGFLKLNVICQTLEQISLPAESRDSLPLVSQPSYDNVELPKLASNACVKSAFVIEGHTTPKGSTGVKLLPDSKEKSMEISHSSEEVVALENACLELEAGEGKTGSGDSLDSPKSFGSNSKIERVEVGLAKSRKGGPLVTRKEKASASCKSEDTVSSQKIELAAAEREVNTALDGQEIPFSRKTRDTEKRIQKLEKQAEEKAVVPVSFGCTCYIDHSSNLNVTGAGSKGNKRRKIVVATELESRKRHLPKAAVLEKSIHP